MSYDQMFGFLVCSAAAQTPGFSSARLQRVMDEIKRLGYGTTLTSTIADAQSVIRSDATIGCIVVEWSLSGSRSEVDAFVLFVRERGLERRTQLCGVLHAHAMDAHGLGHRCETRVIQVRAHRQETAGLHLDVELATAVLHDERAGFAGKLERCYELGTELAVRTGEVRSCRHLKARGVAWSRRRSRRCGRRVSRD